MKLAGTLWSYQGTGVLLAIREEEKSTVDPSASTDQVIFACGIQYHHLSYEEVARLHAATGHWLMKSQITEENGS